MNSLGKMVVVLGIACGVGVMGCQKEERFTIPEDTAPWHENLSPAGGGGGGGGRKQRAEQGEKQEAVAEAQDAEVTKQETDGGVEEK